MRKLYYLAIFVFLFAFKGYSQTDQGKSLTAKDSLEILSQLMKLLDSADSPVSYVFANIGIGNRLFSVKNNALNAYKNTSRKVIYSPSLAYFHKTGFGLTGGANLLDDGTGLGVNQYSLSPSFDLKGSNYIDFNVSYTHYFVKNKFSEFSSPIQNDYYTSLTYKKTWLQPGIALGYATGEYNDYRHKDTVIAGIRKRFYDSVNFKVNTFSIMATAGHQFFWYGVMDKADGLAFTPTLMANAGSGKTTIRHKTNAAILFNILNRKGRIPRLEKNKFEVQSIGLNMDLDYTIGNFTFQPQYYIDYYLPAIDSGIKRITQVFTFNVGYTF